ncbi:MAG TPA: hypothetical protein VHP38_08485 [Ruminiclostridium sp.]|nr:hypothetical protein [Ruminiclostridium sp.]
MVGQNGAKIGLKKCSFQPDFCFELQPVEYVYHSPNGASAKKLLNDITSAEDFDRGLFMLINFYLF